ncbi:hypothetical protein Leryth_008955 [Lithospermum erythrorhizon]|nr:hypothetical protein Leryth_008955 [Lithospermum erythrorhizon]
MAESGRTETVTNLNQVSQFSGLDTSISSQSQFSQETANTGVASGWNQVSQVDSGYPSHMVFDPQYPGWYYDTISQEWRSLDSYTAAAQSANQGQDQLHQNEFVGSNSYSHNDFQKTYADYNQVNQYASSQSFSSHSQDYNWGGSLNSYNSPASGVWEPERVIKNETVPNSSRNQQLENHYRQNVSEINGVSQHETDGYHRSNSYNGKVSQVQHDFPGVTRSHSLVSGENFTQFSHPRPEQIQQKFASNEYFGSQNSDSFPQQSFQSSQQYSHAPSPGRSSAGRPPHALVTFGFGGKLIIMKEASSLENISFPSQNDSGYTVSILNMSEVIVEKADAQSPWPGTCDYFHALCRQSVPGPLAGGSIGGKEVNKWLDEWISSLEFRDMDFRDRNALKQLLSLLIIACQHYGKLRTPFGTDPMLKENDLPGPAVAELFSSAKRDAAQYGSVAHCLQGVPSEAHLRATAAEVQSLLVSGKKKEALLSAQEGQLWGPALVLAAQLGNRFYVDTVKELALQQLVAGSPLRTLCLLIAGQPADVFSADTAASGSMPGVASYPQQSMQLGANGILDDWEENLAVIASNRTKDDELVLIHLGDCLWRERADIFAAHICYLVAEANFEQYSDSARLCLVGADHLKFPRTYVSPEAIQRTEIYEYSQALGNSQFVLIPFQPYKLVYAHMLAEVGRLSDALRYCQAVQKSLKTGRSPEVETLRQVASSLEERIKTHQQGGSTNLAPAKLVGKFLNFFSSLPPTGPSKLQEHPNQPMVPRVSTSQSTMEMSSLVPSTSMEPISEWTGDGSRRPMHNRSVSEPDFGRSPRQGQVDSAKDAGSMSNRGKAASRFGSFGSQLLQKTVGLVLKPCQERQAKLGDSNKFYYDENLKRWVEEGAELPAQEPALPPPPPTSSFQSGSGTNYNLKTAGRDDGHFSNGSPEYKSDTPIETSSGMPPLPPTSNQFSARGRMGVRSRYVDTFNQGGGNPTNLFSSPSVPFVRPAAAAAATNPKFFVPAPVSSSESRPDNVEGFSATDENPSVSTVSESFDSRASISSVPMQRYPSMDNISSNGPTNGDTPFLSHSRRTASWSGSLNESHSSTDRPEIKPLGEVLGMPPSSFIPNGSPLIHSSANSGSYGDELHEVEL